MFQKQMQFDLTMFKENPLRYLFYLLELIFFVMSMYWKMTGVNTVLVVALLLQVLSILLLWLSINTIVDKMGIEFSINKLIYYPTKKSIILCSRCLLVFISEAIVFGLLSIGFGIITAQVGGSYPVKDLLMMGEYLLVIGALTIVCEFGMRTTSSFVVIACFNIPIFSMTLGNLDFSNRKIWGLLLLAVLVLADFILNLINFLRSNHGN